MLEERQYYSINSSDLSSGRRIFGPYDSGGTGWYRARCFGSTGNWSISFFTAANSEAEPDFAVFYENPEDVLLYAYKGRYLWVMLSAEKTSFERIRLYYPAHSFTRYLPGIYQEAEVDSFFPRFLAVFQSVFLDLDEKIAEFSDLLDPAAIDNTHLPTLAGWLGCEEFDFLPDRKRAEFLLKCVEWYKGYGTRAVMSEVLEWLCGTKPIIIEYMDFEDFAEQDKVKKLFFNDMFIFTVLLYETELLPAARKLIEKMKPAYTTCNLAVLKNEIRLDGHSYLGFNSVI